jgi:trehalose/maltose transport system substrate-binding protein
MAASCNCRGDVSVGLRRTTMRKSGVNPRALLRKIERSRAYDDRSSSASRSDFSRRHYYYMKQRLERRVRALSLGFCFALVFSLVGCSRHADRPVTVTILDPEWSQPELLPEVAGNNGGQKNSAPSRARQTGETERFARETGIRVEHSPLPETSLAQLALVQKLLRARSASPDLIGIDVVWPEIIDEYLLDLKPYFSSEISSLDPDLIASFTVKGKVVSIPYHMQIGVLAYRTDLLRKYGYTRPPGTWDELEKMAARIQAGERAEGKKDFWGYVWQGAAAEGLTCNALEWQVSQGGGRIIEKNKTISVNNSAAIQSWQRAGRWVGWISPPGVLSYTEADATNVWASERAAFWRTWEWKYRLAHWREATLPDLTGYTSVPGGAAARVGVLGGTGLAVSRFSGHPREAMALLRFFINDELASERNLAPAPGHSQPELYDLPWFAGANASTQKPGSQPRIISRPSDVTGQAYDKVSQAYMQAVHSVLTHERSAIEAAALLEKELVVITGYKTGPPQPLTSGDN